LMLALFAGKGSFISVTDTLWEPRPAASRRAHSQR